MTATVRIGECPFCESENICAFQVLPNHNFVLCNDCNAQGPAKQTEQEAIQAWKVASSRIEMLPKEREEACAETRMSANNSYPDFVEVLAGQLHSIESDWTSFFLESVDNPPSLETIKDFERKSNTDYEYLTEEEKKYSRHEAKIIIAMLVKALYETSWIKGLAESWNAPLKEWIEKHKSS